jgi:hypothetical protein
MAGLLLGRKADLLTKAGRRVHVQFILTTTIIYLVMSLDLLQWAHKAIDKIRRRYLWRGCKEARGGHYIVAWDIVCRPMDRVVLASPISKS